MIPICVSKEHEWVRLLMIWPALFSTNLKPENCAVIAHQMNKS